MRKVKFSVIVAVVLATYSYPTFALPPNIPSYKINLVVAGSAAFKDTFKTLFIRACLDSVDVYVASASDGGATPDMMAISCNIGLPFLSDGAAIAYYRSEGGSVYGVGPIAKNIQVDRLVVNSNCTGTNHSYTCPVANWNLDADTGTGNLVKDTVMLGVSDLEPAQFVGANWPSGTVLGRQPISTELENIYDSQDAIGRVYAIYVNNSVTGGVSTNVILSKQSITSILNGFYTNWNQVPKGDGSGYFASQAIKICNRNVGSGARAAASIYFAGTGCLGVQSALVNTPTVNASVDTEISCISNTAGAIGYANLQNLPVSAGGTGALPANASVVWINGVEPSPLTAAAGSYDYWFQPRFNSGSALQSNLYNRLTAVYLINNLQDSTTIAGTDFSPGEIALPVGVNSPTLPQVDPHRPIAIGYRDGSNCANPVGYN